MRFRATGLCVEFHIVKRVFTAGVLAGILLLTLPAVTRAQDARSAATSPDASVRSFSIPAQALSSALIAFGEQAGVQFSLGTDLVSGKRSPGLSGRYRTEDALRLLLNGTGLIYRFTAANTVTIEKAPEGKGARVLGPVRVEGAASNAVAGINGSSDPTATEGTKSYTSSALSIASKAPESIKDTPQSVSVITQQRMQDQNITDFNSLMNQATGISVITGINGPLMPSFYSRGFQIFRLQIDGGAPIATIASGVVPLFDMAMYDHAEVLRGADGLFDGFGNPGGVISLTRKRPLDHAQVVVDGQYGSWHNYRATVDSTAPLGFDGHLRGRAVMAYQDQDFFYHPASSNKTLVYAVLEGDLSPTTVLSGGFDATRQHAVPWEYGLPRYQTGADLQLPRSTCLCTGWSRYDFDTKEAFVRLDQALGPDWSLKLNLTRVRQDLSGKFGLALLAVNPQTLTGAILNGGAVSRTPEDTAAELTADGSFELFGHRQTVLVGTYYSKVENPSKGYTNPFGSGYVSPLTGLPGNPPVDVFHFDPEFPEPPSGLLSGYQPEYERRQWGAYASARLTFWSPLHLDLAIHYNQYNYHSVIDTICATVGGCTVNGQPVPVGGVTQVSRQAPPTQRFLSWPPTWALVYDLTKTLSVYGSYTDIYQPNTAFVDHSLNFIHPVTGSNVEGGLKWSGRGGRLNAALSVYRLQQDHFPVLVDYGDYASTFGTLPDGVRYCCYSDTLDETYLSEGADLEVTGEVLPGWQLSGGYTFNENEYQGVDVYGPDYKGPKVPLISLSPKHLLKLWSTYQFQSGRWLHRLNVGGGVNAQSRTYNSGDACALFTTDPSGKPVCDYAHGGDVPYRFSQGFYAVFATRVAYQIDPHWTVSLNLNNLLDKTYYQTSGTSQYGNWYGEPRNFMLTVRGSF